MRGSACRFVPEKRGRNSDEKEAAEYDLYIGNQAYDFAGKTIHITAEYEEDVNPMEGASSMSDAMLVLAVGMMLAVVINWNVDINKNVVREIDNPQTVNGDQITDQGAEQNLEGKGMVYYDPDKDQYYVKVD